MHTPALPHTLHVAPPRPNIAYGGSPGAATQRKTAPSRPATAPRRPQNSPAAPMHPAAPPRAVWTRSGEKKSRRFGRISWARGARREKIARARPRRRPPAAGFGTHVPGDDVRRAPSRADASGQFDLCGSGEEARDALGVVRRAPASSPRLARPHNAAAPSLVAAGGSPWLMRPMPAVVARQDVAGHTYLLLPTRDADAAPRRLTYVPSIYASIDAASHPRTTSTEPPRAGGDNTDGLGSAIRRAVDCKRRRGGISDSRTRVTLESRDPVKS
ncbi:hypothetical protein VTO73DRAFT_12309 [Trametes versicolor]